jgi:5-methylcytosine-specific restriction endonuclease McrA
MKKRRSSRQERLIKKQCEVCGFDKVAALNFHHIIPRCDPRSTNDNSNLAILCHSCHDLVHAGEITIVGVFNSTAGRKMMWFRDGEEPPLPKEYWLIKENPLVVRTRRNN